VATGIEETARTRPASDIAAGTAVETMTYSSDALAPSVGMAWLATNSPPSVPQRLQIRCPPQILLLLVFYFAVILHPRKKKQNNKNQLVYLRYPQSIYGLICPPTNGPLLFREFHPVSMDLFLFVTLMYDYVRTEFPIKLLSLL